MHKLVTFVIASCTLGLGLAAQAQHQGSPLLGLVPHQEYSSAGFFRPSLTTKCGSAAVSGTGEVSGQYAGHSFRLYKDSGGSVVMEIDGRISRATLDASGHVERMVDPDGNVVMPTHLTVEQAKSLAAKHKGEIVAALKDCGLIAPQSKCLAVSNFREPASKSCLDDGSLDESYWSSMFEGEFDQWFNENEWDLITREQCQAMKESCGLACDTNFALSGVSCTAFGIASPPVGLVCGTVAVAAWASCRSRCSTIC